MSKFEEIILAAQDDTHAAAEMLVCKSGSNVSCKLYNYVFQTIHYIFLSTHYGTLHCKLPQLDDTLPQQYRMCLLQ